jgi:hypothetical protein
MRNKTTWYFLLCILICIVPVSCDVQKRLYRPGFFIQKGSSLPVRSYSLGKDVSRSIPENKIDEPSLTTAQNLPWLNYTGNKTTIEKAKNSPQVYTENKQPPNNAILSEVLRNKAIVPGEKVNNTEKSKREGSNMPTLVKEKVASIPEPKNKEYENLILAFLAGAGSVLLLLGIRNGIKKYKGYNLNEPGNSSSKTKEEIAKMADRLDRCADRFANAKNVRVELAARKTAVAINKCDNLQRAKELEKAFNNTYLSPSQASDIQHLKSNNLLSNDVGYGGSPTLKPDVVTTTGGYYANSAGSLSWTMGEPISETISDSNNTLTQGFQQGSYFVVSVVDELAKPSINISVYPNPVSSLLNIKSNSNDPLRAELVDLQGRTVYEQVFENGQGQIDLSNRSDEMYILGVYDKVGNRIKVFKIQKAD